MLFQEIRYLFFKNVELRRVLYIAVPVIDCVISRYDNVVYCLGCSLDNESGMRGLIFSCTCKLLDKELTDSYSTSLVRTNIKEIVVQYRRSRLIPTMLLFHIFLFQQLFVTRFTNYRYNMPSWDYPKKTRVKSQNSPHGVKTKKEYSPPQ